MFAKEIYVKTPICLGVKTNFSDIFLDWGDTFVASKVKFVENNEKKMDFGIFSDGSKEIWEVIRGLLAGHRIPYSDDRDAWWG
jgi:hypothetical protein